MFMGREYSESELRDIIADAQDVIQRYGEKHSVMRMSVYIIRHCLDRIETLDDSPKHPRTLYVGPGVVITLPDDSQLHSHPDLPIY